MLLVSGINFNQRINKKSIAATPNYIAKYHSQPMCDTVNFKGSSALSKLPVELTDFISRYRLILGDIKDVRKLRDAEYFECGLPSGSDSNEAMRIAKTYADLRNTSLTQIIKDAKPTLEGVQAFLQRVLDHRQNFPFIVLPQKEGIIVIARQSYPETYVGAPYLGYANSTIIRDTNPQLHTYMLEHESDLYKDLLQHNSGRYSIWLQKDEITKQNIITGIRLVKYRPAGKEFN